MNRNRRSLDKKARKSIAKEVKKAQNAKDAVVHTHPKGLPARAYKEIAARLLNIDYDSDAEREKFLEKFLKFLKGKD